MLEKAEAELVQKINAKKQEHEELKKKCKVLFEQIIKEVEEVRSHSSSDFTDGWGSFDYYEVGEHANIFSYMKEHVEEMKKCKQNLEQKLTECNEDILRCEKYLPEFERKEAELVRLEKAHNGLGDEIRELEGKYAKYFNQGEHY